MACGEADSMLMPSIPSEWTESYPTELSFTDKRLGSCAGSLDSGRCDDPHAVKDNLAEWRERAVDLVVQQLAEGALITSEERLRLTVKHWTGRRTLNQQPASASPLTALRLNIDIALPSFVSFAESPSPSTFWRPLP